MGRVTDPLPTPDTAELPARAAELLAPLRARYASWLQLDRAEVVEDRHEEPDQVRAMQLILRLERDQPPSWHAALALAASGAARICLDPRVDSDPEWAEAIGSYVQGHIRKVTRRARGASWQATANLPGLTLSQGSTEVRVMRPGPVDELDKRIAKLQVGGTDAPIDEPSAEPSSAGSLIVWVPPEPQMTLGKTMAQTGHAGMIAAALLAGDDSELLRSWLAAGCPVRVRRAEQQEWAELVAVAGNGEHGWRSGRLLAVRDAGFTEIDPGTITIIARSPEPLTEGNR
jgi:peptidyl-tRNA hydrolase